VRRRIASIACEDAAVRELRQPGATGFALRDPLAWADLAAVVRAAEASGYAGAFLPEITARDALVALGALAGETRDLALVAGVVPMRARTPPLLAMAAATVQERSGGRLVLGIGTGDSSVGALDRLRETVATLRALLRGDEVAVRGRPVALALDPGAPVPIWIAALGPHAMRLAGEIADGVLLNWCPPQRVALARARVAEGARAAGRDPDEVVVAAYVRAWVGEDEGEGLSALRAAVGQYASYAAYARQFDEVGLGAQARAAAEAARAGRIDDVPADLVRAVCAVGDGAADHVAAYRAAGADLPVVYPVAAGEPAISIERTLLALAPG
jgi:alkanesulfonate monooxygenase SsuD/methylene tetrahydromethanopterin reductase-like flavin-dependent oxidoreductase (luciferase family)